MLRAQNFIVMIKLSTTRQHRRKGGTRRNTLGIDIGTGAIKMARMVWQDERWTVGNQLVLPIRTTPRDFPQEVCDGLLSEQLRPLQNRPLAQKHDCACVLPMSLTELRSVDVPVGTESDVEQMALESLKDLYPDDLTTESPDSGGRTKPVMTWHMSPACLCRISWVFASLSNFQRPD